MSIMINPEFKAANYGSHSDYHVTGSISGEEFHACICIYHDEKGGGIITVYGPLGLVSCHAIAMNCLRHVGPDLGSVQLEDLHEGRVWAIHNL